MDDFKNRYEAAKNEQVKPEPVVTGVIESKKKGVFKKLRDAFIIGTVDDVNKYVVDDVVIPLIKRGIGESIKGAVDIFFGTGRDGDKKRSRGYRASWEEYYEEPRKNSSVYGRPYEFEPVIFETREDALSVLASMDEIMSRYHLVRVSDLYDLARIEVTRNTDNKYGWKDISSVDAIRIDKGWTLKMPKATPID